MRKIEYYGDERAIDIDDYVDNHVIPIYRKTMTQGERYLVYMGGGGSGKSYFASQTVVIRTLESEENMKTLVVRSDNTDNRSSTFEEIKARLEELGVSDLFNVNKTSMDITCKRNGNSIIFRGMDDEKIKSIQGVTMLWIEEATELTEGEFDQLDIRLRNKRETYPNQFIITFNPISKNHWLKKKFFDTKDPEFKEKTFTMKTNYKDNPYLPEENVKVLEGFRNTSPYYYQVYCMGDWGSVGDSVFDRELLGKRMDEVFGMRGMKRGYFKFDYVGQMITAESIRWVEDPHGAITIYTDPSDVMPYVIGADTAGMGIDYFAGVVINNYTGDIEAQYYQDGKDEKYFTDQLYCLGMWYNEAMINPETNYSTYPVLELARMQYPTLYKREIIGTNDGSRTENRYGFVTTKTSRNTILSLVDEYTKGFIDTIPSIELLEEMSNFILIETKAKTRKSTMRQEAAKGAHDDLIMALGITLFTRDQWERFPKPDRKPMWKRNRFDPLDMYEHNEEIFTIW